MTSIGVRVQRVVMPSGVESATLLCDGVVVDPADRFLAHLAREADVSRSWIYTQPELLELLEQLRPTSHAGTGQPANSRATDESLRRRLALAHQRIAQLRHDNHELREMLAHTASSEPSRPSRTRDNELITRTSVHNAHSTERKPNRGAIAARSAP
jgi:hypothetical protein